MSLFTFPERRRPIPADFAEQCAKAPNRTALRAHYRTCGRSIDRWMAESGLTHPVKLIRPPSRKCFVCLKRIAAQSATGLCFEHYLATLGSKDVEPASRPKFFVADIIAHTATVFGMDEADIRGKVRKRNLCGARFAICYLARELTDFSLPRIGTLLGGRDHSTVLHAVHKCADYMAQSPEYARKVAIVRWLTEGGTRFAPLPEPEPEPTPGPGPVIVTDSPDWWHLSDDELIAQRIAQYQASGGDFVEVF